MLKIVGIGECIVDIVGVVNIMPKENSKKDIHSFKQFVGGSAINAIITLANLGCETSFIGKIGNDNYGRFIKQTLEEERIGTETLKEEGKTPFHFVLVTKKNQSRTIFKQKDNSSTLENLTDFHKFTLKNSKALLLDRKAENIGREAVNFAKKNNILVAFDPSDKFNPFTKFMMRKADVFIAPLGFVKNLKNKNDYRKALMEIWKINKGVVVLTMGPKGCMATNGKKIAVVPRNNSREVIDTNGAGDVFHGAFVYGILRRWPLDKTCKFANKIAALKCSVLGNRLGKLNLKKYT